jgi:hypothetical protein
LAAKSSEPAPAAVEQWRTPGPTDLIFPKWQSELFKTILDEETLRFDREGRPRTAYSLRHTYICLRLMEGADIYQIAKNCRTSVEMIEKYYAAHIKTRLDAAAINVMRPQKYKNKKGKKASSKTQAPPQPADHRLVMHSRLSNVLVSGSRRCCVTCLSGSAARRVFTGAIASLSTGQRC